MQWQATLQDVAHFATSIGMNLFLVSTILLASGLAAARLCKKRGALLQNTILRVTLLCLFLSPLYILFFPPAEEFPTLAGREGAPAVFVEDPAAFDSPETAGSAALVLTWPVVFLFLWPGVAALRFLFLCFQGVLDGYLLRREAKDVTDAEVLGEFRDAAAAIGVAPPQLAATPVTTSPLHAGLFRKVVLLPLSMDRPVGSRSIYLHELSHVKRGDNWWHLLTRLARSCFWFQPLLWKPGILIPTFWESFSFPHWLEETCENAADDLPLACGIDPIEYANTLLDVTEYQMKELAARRRWLGIADLLGAAMASPSELRLKRRLHRVTEKGRLLSTPAPRAIVALVLVSGLLLGMASVTWSESLAGEPTPPRHLWSGRRYVVANYRSHGVVTPESSWTYLSFQNLTIRLVDERLRVSGRFHLYNVSNPEGETDQVMLAIGDKVMDLYYDGNPGAHPGIARWFETDLSLSDWDQDTLKLGLVRVAAPTAEQGVRLYEKEGGGVSFPVAELERRRPSAVPR